MAVPGAARTVLVALTAAATTMRLASATSAASAGAVTCVVFMLWSLVARDWQRPASHLPVVRVIHPVLTVAGATATAAVVCDMLAFDGLERTDWLLVVIVAGASSQLMGRTYGGARVHALCAWRSSAPGRPPGGSRRTSSGRACPLIGIVGTVDIGRASPR